MSKTWASQGCFSWWWGGEVSGRFGFGLLSWRHFARKSNSLKPCAKTSIFDDSTALWLDLLFLMRPFSDPFQYCLGLLLHVVAKWRRGSFIGGPKCGWQRFLTSSEAAGVAAGVALPRFCCSSAGSARWDGGLRGVSGRVSGETWGKCLKKGASRAVFDSFFKSFFYCFW